MLKIHKHLAITAFCLAYFDIASCNQSFPLIISSCRLIGRCEEFSISMLFLAVRKAKTDWKSGL